MENRKRTSVFERLGPGKRQDEAMHGGGRSDGGGGERGHAPRSHGASGHRDLSRDGPPPPRDGAASRDHHQRREPPREGRGGAGHGYHHQRAASSTVLCSYWNEGSCRYGDQCMYSHATPDERRNRGASYGPKLEDEKLSAGVGGGKRGRKSRSSSEERASPKRKAIKATRDSGRETKKEEEEESEEESGILATFDEAELEKKRQQILKEMAKLENLDSGDGGGDSDSGSKGGKESGASTPIPPEPAHAIAAAPSKLARDDRRLYDGGTRVLHTGGLRRRRDSGDEDGGGDNLGGGLRTQHAGGGRRRRESGESSEDEALVRRAEKKSRSGGTGSDRAESSERSVTIKKESPSKKAPSAASAASAQRWEEERHPRSRSRTGERDRDRVKENKEPKENKEWERGEVRGEKSPSKKSDSGSKRSDGSVGGKSRNQSPSHSDPKRLLTSKVVAKAPSAAEDRSAGLSMDEIRWGKLPDSRRQLMPRLLTRPGGGSGGKKDADDACRRHDRKAPDEERRYEERVGREKERGMEEKGGRERLGREDKAGRGEEVRKEKRIEEDGGRRRSDESAKGGRGESPFEKKRSSTRRSQSPQRQKKDESLTPKKEKHLKKEKSEKTKKEKTKKKMDKSQRQYRKRNSSGSSNSSSSSSSSESETGEKKRKREEEKTGKRGREREEEEERKRSKRESGKESERESGRESSPRRRHDEDSKLSSESHQPLQQQQGRRDDGAPLQPPPQHYRRDEISTHRRLEDLAHRPDRRDDPGPHRRDEGQHRRDDGSHRRDEGPHRREDHRRDAAGVADASRLLDLAGYGGVGGTGGLGGGGGIREDRRGRAGHDRSKTWGSGEKVRDDDRYGEKLRHDDDDRHLEAKRFAADGDRHRGVGEDKDAVYRGRDDAGRRDDRRDGRGEDPRLMREDPGSRIGGRDDRREDRRGDGRGADGWDDLRSALRGDDYRSSSAEKRRRDDDAVLARAAREQERGRGGEWGSDRESRRREEERRERGKREEEEDEKREDEDRHPGKIAAESAQGLMFEDDVEEISDDDLDLDNLLEKGDEEGEGEKEGATEEEEDSKPLAKIDALDVAWESLLKEKEVDETGKDSAAPAEPPAERPSALSRFTPAALFASVGVSKDLAGPEVYGKVLEVCRTSFPSFAFSHDVASVHSIRERRRALRSRLTTTGGVGPYPRALCASWDKAARRSLAALPAEGESGAIGVFDGRERAVTSDWIENFKQSLQALRENRSKQVEELTNFDVPCEPIFKLQTV